MTSTMPRSAHSGAIAPCDPSASADLDSAEHAASVGLPGYVYTSAQIFAQEQQRLWRNTWQWVGRVEEIPNPGDYLTCRVGQEPIVVIRQADLSLRAMHNVCPHRGARLLEGHGTLNRVMRCPYHAWTYRPDGQLVAVPQPQQFPDLDLSCIQLQPASVDCWGGFMFVHPSAEAEPLADHLAGIPDFFAQYDHAFADLREVDRWSYREPVNWKFVVENYAEDYHFSIVHPQSLGFYDVPKISTRLAGRHYLFQIPYAAHEPSPEHRSMWERGKVSYQGYLFPNMMINTEHDHVSVFRLYPLNALETEIEVILYQTPEQRSPHPDGLEQLRQSHEQVMAEDFEVCRLLQLGAHSRAYRVTHLATEREKGIAQFHQTIREYLTL
ncbi:MAG: aromatic ring-hydroxylating dioxygenase subunit alpha [Leptolyngbyaceae bacterium]|nr:aromatic ring-hydroxylating dioxygenase subunit alpha [Leptolyngbyaceae bacterium]